MNTPSLSVIMPALNEEKNIKQAIQNTIIAFDDYSINGEIVVINDGSTDTTQDVIQNLSKNDSRVRLINHNISKGVGTSFWDGVDYASGNIVVMIPGDNENDPWETLQYYQLLEYVDIVIPFAFNKEVRSLYRNILSFIYRFIINTTFRVYFNYTNGTILYRKSILKELDHRSSGFFFQTDILIRATKRGYLFAEVPFRLNARIEGVSKAVTFPSLIQVIRGYFRLVRDIYYNNNEKNTDGIFATDSLTLRRRKEKDVG